MFMFLDRLRSHPVLTMADLYQPIVKIFKDTGLMGPWHSVESTSDASLTLLHARHRVPLDFALDGKSTATQVRLDCPDAPNDVHRDIGLESLE